MVKKPGAEDISNVLRDLEAQIKASEKKCSKLLSITSRDKTMSLQASFSDYVESKLSRSGMRLVIIMSSPLKQAGFP